MIDTKFDLYDKVKILPLGGDGVITAITKDYSGVGYKVRYFHDGKCEEVYFFDWELKKK